MRTTPLYANRSAQATILALLIVLCSLSSAFAQQQKTVRAEREAYNVVAGTQAIGGSYQFTNTPMLVEAAHAILALGSNTIKFTLAPDKSEPLKPHSLTETARNASSVNAVLKLPFRYYLLWVYPVSTEANRFHPDSLPNEYREIYDLTCYLLQFYNKTGKTFYLGNWEGDWHLTHTNPDYVPTEEEVHNMIAWVNIRQKAVDAAKRDTGHQNVQVYYYLEVNRVADAMEGKVRLTNAVLPYTPVDFVSYSAYDAINDDTGIHLIRSLDYIASKLPPKNGIPGKRVFVGEYGFPARLYTPQEQNARSIRVLRTALEWGCPFVLYWELYNNEVQDGKQVGFWMIDDHQVKQPIYDTHRRFYLWAQRYLTNFEQQQRRLPTRAEFGKAAVAWLDQTAVRSSNRNTVPH